MVDVYNASVGSINSYSYGGLAFWPVTILIMGIIVIIGFFLFKNVRRAIWGGLATGGVYCLYLLSSTISGPLMKGDTKPAETFAWIVGVVIASISAGWILEKAGITQPIEKAIDAATAPDEKPKVRK